MTNQLSEFNLNDIIEAFGTRVFAFTGISDGSLGISVANESGYSPVSKYFYFADDEKFDTAQKEADRLNDKIGITDQQAIEIVTSSMFHS